MRKAISLTMAAVALILAGCGETVATPTTVLPPTATTSTDAGTTPQATAVVSDEGPILVGASASLSGANKSAGTSLLQGYQAWEKYVNDNGGLLGRQVKLIYYDDQSDSATAVKLYRKLITEDKVNVALGPYGSGITFAVSAATESYSVPLVATAAGASNIWQRGLKYVFQGEAGSEYLALPGLEVAQSKGLTKVAVLYDDNSWGKDWFSATTKLAPEHGIQITYSAAYPVDAKDVSSQLLAARESGAEFISSSAYLPDSELITRQLKDMNWAPQLVYLATAYDSNFSKDLGTDAEGITGYAMWSPLLNSHLNTEFQAAYKQMFNIGPDDKAAIGFSAGQVLQAAIEKTGSLDSAKIRDYIATSEIPTVLAGTFKVDENGLQAGYKVLLMQWQGGELKIVSPADLAIADVLFPLKEWSAR